MSHASKVQVMLSLDNDSFTAGEELRGEVRIQVKTQLQCKSVRLHLVGKETATLDQMSESFTTTAYYLKRYVYLSRSNNRVNGHRELLSFAPGYYTFPFHIKLESRLPPTYFAAAGPSESLLRYVAEAEMVFGAGKENIVRDNTTFVLRSCVSPMQVSALENGGKSCAMQSPVFRHACLFCFCGDEDGEVRAEVSIVPGIYALYKSDRDAQHDTPNRDPIVAKLKLQNSCNKAIFEHIEIIVRNVICIPFDIQNRFYTSKIAFDGWADGCHVEPGDEGELTIPLTRRFGDFATTGPLRGLLPSMQTTTAVSVYIIEVRLKGFHTQQPLVSVGQLEVSEVLSEDANAPALPCRYMRLVHPEPDASFIPTAREIELPHDVFPEEHTPYLPRPADYPMSHRNLNEIEAEKERRRAKGRPPPPPPPGEEPVAATVVPGNIVEGYIMSGDSPSSQRASTVRKDRTAKRTSSSTAKK